MPAGRRTHRRVHLYGRETPALVAVVNRHRDWNILLTQHWYRIPVRTAPAELKQFRYLAFYQTGIFGAERWAVNYYAKVKRVSRKRRIELLPDEASHPRAEDLYYRVEVEELLPLPRPIPSLRLRRIVFIPSSLE
ncbi:MAG: hypothetical protein ABIK43_02115, partial [candidate division WOR-3 bacterium]